MCTWKECIQTALRLQPSMHLHEVMTNAYTFYHVNIDVWFLVLVQHHNKQMKARIHSNEDAHTQAHSKCIHTLVTHKKLSFGRTQATRSCMGCTAQEQKDPDAAIENQCRNVPLSRGIANFSGLGQTRQFVYMSICIRILDLE